MSDGLPLVIIDARMVNPISHGISKYVCHLAQALQQKKQVDGLKYEVRFLVSSDFEKERKGDFFGFKTIATHSSFLSPNEILEIPKILKQSNASLYHSPSFSSLVWSPCPWVVTLHDLNHLTYGSFFKKIYYETILKYFAKQAKKVMTVSDFSRAEISKWLNIPKTDVVIAPNVMENLSLMHTESEESKILSHFKVQKNNYFLCLSNSKPHKNLRFIFQVYEAYFRSQNTAWPLLVTVGKSALRSLIEGVHLTGGLSDREVSVLLKNAGAVLFPSLYEGFGRPPLEAMLAGVPVLASKIPPHEEAVKGIRDTGIRFLDPQDLGVWVRELEKATQKALPPPSKAAQDAVLQRYSFGVLVNAVDQVYCDVLGI